LSTANILFDLLIVFAVAKVFGEVFERLRLPAVVGEILAGMLVGPSGLRLVALSPSLTTVAVLGVVVLRFAVGLETKPSQFFRVGPRAFLVAAGGVVLSLAGGVAFGMAFGFGWVAALFVGTAIVSTSVGVTARVLKDRGLLRRSASRLVLAAAVIDDVIGLLVLAIVVGSVGGHLDLPRILVVFGEIALFLVFELWIAPRLVKRHVHMLDGLRMPNAPFVIALIIMLTMAAISEQIGLAAVVGAFLAGMMLAETEDCYGLSRDTRPLYDWLVPYFFALIGMQVQLSLFADPRVLALGVALFLLAVATKVVGCGLAAYGHGLRQMLAVGVGMIPRVEVALIVAAAGLQLKVLDARLYAVIVFVAITTTLVSPMLLPFVMPSTAEQAKT
jgi:Kef-type K+ transport system membrane component KefB